MEAASTTPAANALTGIACVIYYLRQLTKSARNLLFIGIAPLPLPAVGGGSE